MKTYIKFIIKTFLTSLMFVFLIMISLVFILNLLTELDFFKEIEVDIYFPLFLSLLNSPAMIFEIFPFIFLITTQFFFIKLMNNNEINIFKYSGLENTRILVILGVTSITAGIIISTIFYNLSSNLKNIYLELKSNYTSDGKYLAVITNNGLWIKDEIDGKILIINASKVENNTLIDSFITEFDKNFKVTRNIQSNKIDISKKTWVIYEADVINKNNYEKIKEINLRTNFDFKRIQTLYSNLSSLNFFHLYELRENYIKLNYSITEINLQILKLISYPIYLLLITIFSSIIMLKFKQFEGNTIKIAIGLFFSVVIYYFNNFSFVLGSTERIPEIISIFLPLIIMTTVNSMMIYKINEK